MNLREWALPIYTILIQLATGVMLALWVIKAIFQKQLSDSDLKSMNLIPLGIIVLTILMGVIGAHFHLSRPLFSLFSILNIKTSWLSREIAFTILLFLFSVITLGFHILKTDHTRLSNVSGWLTVFWGFCTVYCMANIYILPTQTLWSSSYSLFSYFATTLLLGVTSLSAILLMVLNYSKLNDDVRCGKYEKVIRTSLPWMAGFSMLFGLIVFSLNIQSITSLQQIDHMSARISLQLILDLYWPLVILRFVFLILGIIHFCSVVFIRLKQGNVLNEMINPSYISFIFIVAGEVLGRFLFYATHVRVGI